MKFNLKTKLITSFTIIIVMTGLITAIVGILLISKGVINQVQDKVRTDLNTAREILNNRVHDIEKTIYSATHRNVIKNALIRRDIKTLKKYLDEIKEAGNIKILSITDRMGTVILRAQNPSVFGDSQADDQLIKKVLSRKQVVASPVVIRCEELEKEGEDFAECAHIWFIQTPKAKKREEKEDTSGLMLKAAAPIWGSRGDLIGVLYGGVLINRNYSLVDKIKNIVYQGERYKGMDMGTATIFQDDLRISTNVMTDDGKRAVGTRVSEEVYNRVIEEGKQWIGRAFVVNAWYITAYESIRDIDEQIIGMLYVGMLEQKFVDIKSRTLLMLLSITAVGMIVALIVSNFFANEIIKPISHLVDASRRISGGDFSTKVDVETGDEIGELEMAFNSMALALEERDEELKNQTERQLMRSEKLAALGRMAAGIAHEINNPLTGVLMYGHLLLKEIPEGSQSWEDAEIIVNETTRCRELIRDLLDFSRENIPHKEQININDVIDKTISIIENQVYFEKVDIIKELSEDLPELMVDINQIEQVLINLALNAAEAMSNSGRLIFQTRFDIGTNSVVIRVVDTGTGIPEENVDKIFDPFYTTKEVGKGTGLGLAVSYGIIQRHDGHISVETQMGVGTSFTIRLPVDVSDPVRRT